MAQQALTAQLPPPEADEADEYLEIDGPQGQLIEHTDDGGMLVTISGGDEEDSKPEQGGFYENLAEEIIPPLVLDRIATELLEKIAEDKDAREDRDKQYEEGLKRTGLGKDAPGGAEFTGASKVVHPMLTEACVDFVSRVMKEFWPPSGPVKPKILGEVTKQKDERAKRKTSYMNYQLTTVIREAREVMESMLSQLPLGGSQFVRLWQDHAKKRPRMQFCPVDKIILPDNAASYASADRRTFSDTISAVEMKRRMRNGVYRKVELGPAPMKPDGTKSEDANRKIEGVTQNSLNIDGDREIYEVMAVLEVTSEMADVLKVEEEGELYPYLVTIDVTSKKVLSFYRDWEEDDETKEPIEHLYEFRFLPWRGAYAIGLPQIAGGLSGAATGALRALLDAALIANMPGGFILKGSGSGAQNKVSKPTEFIEIDSGMEAGADIREKVMPFPAKEPSAVLFQLLGFLVEAGKGIVRTSLDESAIDTNANTPVGTQMSRVEEGMVVFSAIHGRVHASFNRLLEGLHRLNRLYLDKVVKAEVQGNEILIRRRDFEGTPDLQPVSDPTIYSDLQRMGQVQSMQARAAMVPGLYNVAELEKWFLQLMKVPDPERFLVPSPQPHELNAVNENLAMGLGRPVVAFPDQDHLAHLQAHFDFADSPVLGSNPIMAPKFMPAFVQHCAEHICYHYVQRTTELVQHAAGVDASELFSKDNDVKAALDRLLATASTHIVPGIAQDFTKAMPVIQKAVQMVQAMMPKPPMDPAMAASQASAAETARKSAADQAKAQTDQGKVATQAQTAAQKTAVDMERVQAMKDNAALAADTALKRTELETETARDIEDMRIESGQGRSGLKDGASLSG